LTDKFIDNLDPTTVVLSDNLITEARVLAEATFERFARVRGSYRNTLNSHFVGRLGELLVEQFLLSSEIQIDSAFRDSNRDRECDLLSGQARLEVKTWNSDYWAAWGRCIAVTQLPAIKRKADIFVWTTVSDPRSARVTGKIRGWNYVEDVAGHVPMETGPAGHKVLNYQIPTGEVRPMGDLFERLCRS
jgi:hypothetical protein